LPDPGNKKAAKGTCTHKALELLARQQVARQEAQTSFVDEETGGHWLTNSFSVPEAVETAWHYYTCVKETPFEWFQEDFEDVARWTDDALAYHGGLFDPRQRTVVWPEKYFDFTIDKPWAWYSFDLPDGTKLEGQLSLKGTLDLVCEVDGYPGVYELVDWKTGMRKCWNTGTIKDYQKLRDDPQLRIYHYALTKLLPRAKEIFVSIVWIQDGGPYPLPFGPEDLEKTEAMLQKRFERIRDTYLPKLIKGTPQQWKCSRLCEYGKKTWPGSGKTICEHLHGELLTLGMDKVTAQYGNQAALTRYGDGGGRSGAKTGR
jgi:hypothetical protein